MREYAVIGGGIGGCSSAALLSAAGKDVVLLEKEPYLGGCASTFQHRNYRYNTGATTVSGYREGGVLKHLFSTVGVEPDLIETDPAIVIIQGERIIPRYRDIERFIDVLNHYYPHPKHTEFWYLIQSIVTDFYAINGYRYSNASLLKKAVSLASFSPLVLKFWKYLWSDARRFIQQFYGGVCDEYLDFLDAQILIVAQAKSESVNFMTAALSLGYTFDVNHYVVGGMGNMCETLTSNVPDVRLSHEMISVTKLKNGFRIATEGSLIEARNLIMGTTHFESSQWFDDTNIKKYYKGYDHLNNHQSAFVVYMSIPTPARFAHHFQLISKNIIPFTLSKSLFVSLSDPADTKIAPKGVSSITASIHTDARLWIGLAPAEYRRQKESLHRLLEQWICDTLFIDKHSILQSFAATPKTFGRYLNRIQLGGIPMLRSNFLPILPSNDTPIRGFYQAGDTSYAAQGWPGVVMGAINLMSNLDE